jgi:hypothetical protein
MVFKKRFLGGTMGLLEKSQWQEWARQWGLTHHPQRGGFARNEWLVGSYRGHLLRIGWAGDYGSELYVLIRFPKQQDALHLHERLLHDPQLETLPGWKKKRTLNLIVEESSVLWKRSAAWGRPRTEVIQQWVEQLLQALSKYVQPFDGHCEQCGGSGVKQYVLIEQVLPVYWCSACQDRLVTEGAMAERKYAQLEANYTLGALYGLGAAVVGGGGWALLAIGTRRIYALAAIGIAWLVAWAYYKGAGKIDRLGQAIGAVLTLAGVVFGEVLFYAQMVHTHQPEIPFRIDVGWQVFVQVLQENPGEPIMSLLFGLIGVWYIFRFLRRPRFTPKIERPPE